MVQTIIESRQQNNTLQIGSNIFSGRIFCGDCGSAFGSKVWHSNDKYRRVIWQCNNKFKNKKKCTTPHFTEKELQTLFVAAVNKLLPQKAQLKADFELIKDSLFSTDELQTELNGLQKKLRETADLLDACIERNAREALDQNEFNAEYEELTERYLDTQERMNTVSDEINKKRLSKKRISDFLKTLYRQENLLTEFDGELFGILVERVTVYSKEDVRFTFINGMEI